MFVSGSHIQARGAAKKPKAMDKKNGLTHDLPEAMKPTGKPKMNPRAMPSAKSGASKAKPLASAKVSANKRSPRKG